MLCKNCRTSIMCDFCGLEVAVAFGIGTISDELVMTKQNACDRCYRVGMNFQEPDLPRDAEVARLGAITKRNTKAWIERFNNASKGAEPLSNLYDAASQDNETVRILAEREAS